MKGGIRPMLYAILALKETAQLNRKNGLCAGSQRKKLEQGRVGVMRVKDCWAATGVGMLLAEPTSG